MILNFLSRGISLCWCATKTGGKDVEILIFFNFWRIFKFLKFDERSSQAVSLSITYLWFDKHSLSQWSFPVGNAVADLGDRANDPSPKKLEVGTNALISLPIFCNIFYKKWPFSVASTVGSAVSVYSVVCVLWFELQVMTIPSKVHSWLCCQCVLLCQCVLHCLCVVI